MKMIASLQTPQHKLKAGIWTTKKGDTIPVGEMTTPHLQQSIGVLRRRSNHSLSEEWVKLMQAELKERP